MRTSTAFIVLVTAALAAGISLKQLPPDPKQEPKSTRASCGETKTLAFGEEMNITSPGYPKKYPGSQKCVWNINSEDPEGLIEISCPNFDLKWSKKCKRDKFILADGKDMKETVCGHQAQKHTTKSNSLKAVFKSTKFGSDKGFQCCVKSVRSGSDSTSSWGWGSTAASKPTTKPPATKPPATKPPATKPPATKPPGSGKCECGVPNLQRIVGGTEVKPANKYPWHAALKIKGGANYWCGATIINNRYVLTAAHCFFDQDGNRNSDEGLVVGVGDHDMTNTNDDVAGATRLIDVEKVKLHESYKPKQYDWDIAVLKLKVEIDLSKHKQVKPICLPADDKKTYAGVTGIATGWGRLYSGGPQPDKLKEVSLPILEPSCWGIQGITERMLCAGYKEGGKDTCQGDSGGPLYVVENSKYVQVGVTSHGAGCANANSPGVYSRVTKYLSWIKTNSADGTYC